MRLWSGAGNGSADPARPPRPRALRRIGPMSPELILLQLLAGLAHAMVLFLIASGLSLIFGVTRIVNFAHGSFYMLAAYLAYSLASALPLGPASFYVAVVLAAVATGLVGWVVE